MEYGGNSTRGDGGPLSEDYKPLADMRATSEYRSQVAANLLYRFYLETTEPKTETRVYNYGEN